MKTDHDNKGRFKKGNKAAAGKKEIREMRGAIKEELSKCAYSLLRPIKTIEEETKKGNISRYQYILNKAVVSGNIKLITWLTEMVIGKPKNIDVDKEESMSSGVFIPVAKEQQAHLLEMAMLARLEKEKEEKKGFIE